MARKRMIDPGIWTSEDFSRLSLFARLVWIGLISSADDEGKGKANVAFLKTQIFPYDDELSTKDIEQALKEIESLMSIKFYEIEGKKYYLLTRWKSFQNINRPSPSRLPSPKATENEQKNDNFSDNSVSSQEECSESVVRDNKNITDGSLPNKEIKEINKELIEDKELKEKYKKKNAAITESEIINYLNEKAGTHFKCGENNCKFIKARLQDYSVEDLKRVIDKKVAEWKGTTMQQYLRPETLFNATKFESYYGGLDSGVAKVIIKSNQQESQLERAAKRLGVNL